MLELLREGDIIVLDASHTVTTLVPVHFLPHYGRPGCFELVSARVQLEPPFDYLTGRYVVYKTATEKGGSGHGAGDRYPDQYRVYAERLINRKIRVLFYQEDEGMQNIVPVAKAICQWIETPARDKKEEDAK